MGDQISKSINHEMDLSAFKSDNTCKHILHITLQQATRFIEMTKTLQKP